ncbi:MAG: ABC transporter permease subunit [Oscillospiraceae bacterium]|nr:ABC transporter permease subunit [Oscillospiraceae bacterium]
MPAKDAAIKKKPASRKKKLFTRDDGELTLLSLPTIIWFVLFSYLPMFGIVIAFKNYRMIPGEGFLSSLIQSDWVGFKNFRFMFLTADAWIMVRNTLLYNFAFIVIEMFLPVTLAILMSQLISDRLRKISQTAMFLPHFLSWVVVAYFVFSFLSYDKGIANQILISLGTEPVNWYAEGKYWPYILVFLNTWKTVGYSMVIYLASIAGIDHSFYEAAVIDGATKWQQARSVTLPQLKPVIVILLILAMGRIFNSDFGLFYQATRASGQITDYRQTIDTYVYTALMKLNNIGFSSAASALQSVVGCVMITLANFVVRKIDPDSSLF